MIHHRDFAGSASAKSVAVGVVDDAPIIVSGHHDGTVWVWDARSGQPRYAPLSHGPDSQINAVAFGMIDGQPVIVAGGCRGKAPRRPTPDDSWAFVGFVQLWDARTGEPRGAPRPHGNNQGVKAVAIGVVDDTPVLVSGGGEVHDHVDDSSTYGTVCLWDARTGRLRGKELSHSSSDTWVMSVAAGMIDGQPVVVSGGLEGTVGVWDARIGKLRNRFCRPSGRVCAVAMGVIDGVPIVVSGDRDGGLYLWDARSGQPLGGPLRHGNWLEAAAMGVVDGHPLFVSGGRGEVRLWDGRTGQPLGEPLRHHSWVESVVVGAVDERPVIVAANGDGVRVWDARDVISGVVAAFDEHLAACGRLHGDETERRLRELLEALAWSERPGVSGGLIPALVSAVTGGVYSDDDVATLLGMAAGHVDRARVEGWLVYRLSLGPVREHLRAATVAATAGTAVGEAGSGDAGDVAAAIHARITEALLTAGRAGEWTAADPYLERDLPRHAALAGQVERLLSEPGYPEAADPDALLAVLPAGDSAPARTYRRAAHALRGRRPAERALALQIAAAAEGEEHRPQPTDLRLRWRRGPLASYRQDLIGHDGDVHSVAMGNIDGDPVIVSGGEDRTVRLWDARSGVPRGKPLRGHTEDVTAVSIADVDGQSVVVSKDRNGVRLWDAHTGSARAEPLSNHEPLEARAVGSIDDHPVCVRAAGGTVQVIDDDRGPPAAEPGGHVGAVMSVAAGILDGQPVVVSGGLDGTVRLWGARTGKAMREPLGGHAGGVMSVGFGAVDGHPLVVAGGDDGKVRLWDARSGEPLATPLCHGGSNHRVAVATAVIDGQPVIVSGAFDGTVRLWDPGGGTSRRKPWRAWRWGRRNSRQGRVTAVAVGIVDGQGVVVAGTARGTLVMWDAHTGRRRGRPRRRGHRETVTSVSAAVIDGRPTIVSGGADGTVRLWDARSGTPRGEPKRGHDGPVMSVAVAVIDGQDIVVSGGADATVRLWGPATTTVLPVLSSVTSLAVVDGGLAVATCSSLLVVDVPSLPAAAHPSVGGDPTSSR